MNGWTDRAWVAEPPRRRSGDSPYVIWDIPWVRESLIADYAARGWTVYGPYEPTPGQRGPVAHPEVLRLHGRALKEAAV